jgi:hypothetical protein
MKLINRFGRVEDFPEKIALLMIKSGSHKAHTDRPTPVSIAPKPNSRKAKKAE